MQSLGQLTQDTLRTLTKFYLTGIVDRNDHLGHRCFPITNIRFCNKETSLNEIFEVIKIQAQ